MLRVVQGTALLALVDAVLSELRDLEEDQRTQDRVDRWSAVTELTDDDLPLLDGDEFIFAPDLD